MLKINQAMTNPYIYIEHENTELSQKIKDIILDYYDYERPSTVYSVLFIYFCENIEKIEIDLPSQIMSIIENTLTNGDEEFKNAATMSFLEDLTNPVYINLFNKCIKYFEINTQDQISKIKQFWKEN